MSFVASSKTISLKISGHIQLVCTCFIYFNFHVGKEVKDGEDDEEAEVEAADEDIVDTEFSARFWVSFFLWFHYYPPMVFVFFCFYLLSVFSFSSLSLAFLETIVGILVFCYCSY